MFKIKVFGLYKDYVKDDVSFETRDEAEEFGVDFQINHEWCYGFEVVEVTEKATEEFLNELTSELVDVVHHLNKYGHFWTCNETIANMYAANANIYHDYKVQSENDGSWHIIVAR